MRLACASSAFSRALERGDLTQLEFVDACARELACDGVVLDASHFPRLDNDYLAQLKKMTTDLGLSVAAFEDDAFFAADIAGMERRLERAWRLGAPLLASRLGHETAAPWSDQMEAVGRAAALAKGANVTIAARNERGTHAATAHDCKRLVKEVDSAWFRFGLQPSALDAASDPTSLVAHTVLLFADAIRRPDDDRIEAFVSFRGFLALDRADGAGTFDAMRDAIRARAVLS